MKPTTWIAIGVSLCLVASTDLKAQATPTALYLAYIDESGCTTQNFPACKVSRLLKATIDGPRSRIDWQRVVPGTDDIREGYVTPDGRFVVWLAISLATGPNVYIHDGTANQTTAVGPLDAPETLLGNPVRPEVYVFDRTGLTTISATGTRRLDLSCRPAPGVQPADISADGRLVSVVISCAPSATPITTVMFDTETNAVVASVPAAGVVSADGTALYTRGNRAANHMGPVFDLASGLAAAFTNGGLTLTDLRARVDFGRAPMRAWFNGAIMFGPPAPAPPVAQGPVVSVSSVQFSWVPGGPPAAVTRYVLEAGSAPGLGDIIAGLDVGLQTSFAASGVPPGRYYVRIRAGNYTGLSAPSNEIVVTVP
jgi:hypothetical protein